jgi:iron complex outermembrane receptor protein
MTQMTALPLAAFALLLPGEAAVAGPAPVEGARDMADQAALPAAPGAPRRTPAIEEMLDEEIVVTAGRPPGQTLGNVEPEIQLGPRDIRGFGATSLADLLQQLGPQLQSGAGRGGGPPLVLLDGQRVSGFQEIRNYPPEAILRVDILPEEAALAYGARPNQRVINFVLRPRFRSVAVEIEAGGATAGGRPQGEVEASLLRIRSGTRISLEAEHERLDGLLESERKVAARTGGQPFAIGGNIVSPVPGAEIDPALSALAGTRVTVAAVPPSAAGRAPALADFLPGAGQPAFTDQREVRSLLPETHRTVLGGTIAGTVGPGVAGSLNARLERESSDALLGLAPATLGLPAGNPFSPFAADTLLLRLDPARPLVRETDTANARIGVAMNGRLARWQWSLTGSFAHDRSDTLTDRRLELAAIQQRLDAGDPALNPFGPAVLAAATSSEFARSRANTLGGELLLNGGLFRLPAGEAAASLKLGGQTRRIASVAVREGDVRRTDLGRDEGRLQASLDLPIASRRAEVLQGLGNLALNANLAVETLSDFGSLVTLGGGLNWSPLEPLRINASFSREEGAPTIGQLGNPLLATPNVRVFDQARGETVEVTRLDGGNPELLADSRDVLRIGVSLRPLDERNLTLSANYVASRLENPVNDLPALSPAIEAAFPDRFLRDADGRLVRIDARPVNFERSDRSEIRYGFNLFQQLPPTRAERARAEAIRTEIQRRIEASGRAGAQEGRPQGAPGAAGAFPDAAPRGFGGFGGGRGGGMGGPPPGVGPGGGLQLSLFHTVRLKEDILIREGVPVLDLLDGSAVGSRGGQPRHQIQLQAGLNRGGLGGRVEANWQSATEVRIDPAPGTAAPGDLLWSSLGTVNLRLFADLGQATGRALTDPWLRGLRLSLRVDNLFDAKPGVRTRLGDIPAGLEPDRLDPVGRRVVFSVRKLFVPVPAILRRPA